VKFDIADSFKIPARNCESGSACIYTVEPTDAGSDELRPSAAAASKIEPNGVPGQRFPGENFEIPLKLLDEFVVFEMRLIESAPFFAKPFNRLRVNVPLHQRM
jgi:hypothetical protein